MLQVYSKRNCPRCARTKNLLSEKGILYEELIIGEHVTRDQVVSLFPDAKQVPILSLDGSEVNIEDL